MKQKMENISTGRAQEDKSLEQEGHQKKKYVKPVWQKHESLKVAAAATQCLAPVPGGGS